MSKESSAAQLPPQGGNPLHPALLLWFVFAVTVVIKMLASPHLHTVFPKFAAGAEHWWAGRPLYEKYPDLGAFRYSPTFAVLMTPFAWLETRWGGAAWSLLNITAYVWAVRRLARYVLPGEWPAPREALLLALALPIAIRGFWNGQSNGLVAACLLLAAAALARQRWALTAGLLAGAIYLKLTPIAVALLLAALMPGRLAPRLAGAMLFGGLLPFLTQSPDYVKDQYHDWFVYLRETADDRWPSFRDARTLWEWAGITTDLRLYAGLQGLAGLLVLAWCWRQKRRWAAEPRVWITLALAAGIGYLMLFGPAIELATYILIAPIAAWAVLESARQRKGRWLAGSAFVVTFLFTFGALERSLSQMAPFLQAGLPFGTLLLMIWLVAYGRHSGRQGENP